MRIKEIREAAGLTRIQVADRLGVTVVAVRKWETGLAMPNADKLPALADRRPWLEEHRLQVIALGAAGLFGLSLLAFPRPAAGEEEEPPDCCDGYEPVE